MKHLIVLFLFFAFITPESISQTLIKEKAVPTLVKNRFNQKFRAAKEIKWFKNKKENSYTAKYLEIGISSSATLDLTGKVIETRKNIELDKLNNKIARNLKTEYNFLDPYKATLIKRGRGEQYFSIILHEDMGRKKEPLVYEIQYNFQGKYLTIYEPVKEVEEDVIEKDDYDKELEDNMDQMSNIEYNIDIKKSELPSRSGNYLKSKFNLSYRYNTVRLNKDEKYGPHYFVKMKKFGEKGTYQLWFDINGKLLKENKE